MTNKSEGAFAHYYRRKLKKKQKNLNDWTTVLKKKGIKLNKNKCHDNK